MALSEKWAPVFENEELAAKVIPMQPEEAQKVLAENGFNFTMDEILEAGNELYAMRERLNNDGELNEDDLEDVAGGVNWGTVEKVVKFVGSALSKW